MKSFFKNLFINVRDFFTSLKNLDIKKKIIIAVCFIVAAAVIITAVSLSKELKEPEYNSEEIAYSYALCVAQNNYFDSLQYTVMGKKGADKFIFKNYLNEADDSSVREKDEAVISDMTDVMQEEFNARLTINGFGDFDGFLSWYFETLSTRVETYSGKEYVKQELMLNILRNNFQNYMTEVTNEKIADNEDGKYEVSIEKTDEKEFDGEEVKLFAQNKSEKALEILDKCGISQKRIKGLRKYTYSVTENGRVVNTINVYVIKSGAKWFVDTTALVY